MRAGRPRKPIVLSEPGAKDLNALANSRSMPYGLVTRAKIILLSAQGLSNREIAAKVDYQDLDVHLVVDNYATHKHPRIRRWLAAHPRFHVHLTPTCASWLNQVEIWFNIITQQAIRRGTFRSVRDLTMKIDHFVQSHNSKAQPFVWTATADSILAKIKRLCQYISETQH